MYREDTDGANVVIVQEDLSPVTGPSRLRTEQNQYAVKDSSL